MGHHDKTYLRSLVHLNPTSPTSPTSPVWIGKICSGDRKIQKYEGLPEAFVFQPMAIETMGRYNSSALGFISEIGSRTSSITGDVREAAFLYQRLSVCIQRYNMVAFKGSFPLTPEDEA